MCVWDCIRMYQNARCDLHCQTIHSLNKYNDLKMMRKKMLKTLLGNSECTAQEVMWCGKISYQNCTNFKILLYFDLPIVNNILCTVALVHRTSINLIWLTIYVGSIEWFEYWFANAHTIIKTQKALYPRMEILTFRVTQSITIKSKWQAI